MCWRGPRNECSASAATCHGGDPYAYTVLGSWPPFWEEKMRLMRHVSYESLYHACENTFALLWGE